MGTNLIRAMLLASASVAVAAAVTPVAAHAQEATYQIDIPAQSMGDALRALGKATKQNIVFNGSLVKGKRSAAVRGRMSAGEALDRMLQGSGLKMSRGSGGGLVVQGGNAQNGVSQEASSPQTATAPKMSSGPSRSAVPGAVVDANTGRALRGALVQLVETGESTSTSDLGEFRFPGRTGTFTLRISYLGYQPFEYPVELEGGRATRAIALSDSDTQDIIVIGNLSARAQSLSQERKADNVSTIIAADDLGNLNGSTISDTLRRAAGVAFQPDQGTGDGANIVVRGMAPDFNQVSINGLRLPVGNGFDRSGDLSNILTESVGQVTINKTLLPSQDGAGTGGLVEIETLGPLDRPDRFFQVSAERGGILNDFNRETSASGTASIRFGPDKRLGISLSAQFREKDSSNIAYGAGYAFGDYLPLGPNGEVLTTIDEVDPRQVFPFEGGGSAIVPTTLSNRFDGVRLKNYALSGSVQAKIGTHTMLRIDGTFALEKRNSFNRSQALSAYTSYVPSSIEELGGDVRSALLWEDAFGPGAGAFIGPGQSYNFIDGKKNRTRTLSFKGETNLGRIEARYGLGYADARDTTPASNRLFLFPTAGQFIPLAPEFLTPEAGNFRRNGLLVSLFAPQQGNGLPTSFLSDVGYDYFNDIGNFNLSDANSSGFIGRNKRYTADGSLRYNFEKGPLSYLEGGLFYESATFRSVTPATSTSYIFAPGTNAGTFGFTFSDDALGVIGIPGGLRVIERDQIEKFFRDLPGLASDPTQNITTFENEIDERLFSAKTKEDVLAAYLQTKIQIGRLDIVGGVRVERTTVTASVVNGANYFDANFVPDLAFAAANAVVLDLNATQTSFLPRVTLNYRGSSENLVVRGGYYFSLARPGLFLLGGARNLSYVDAPIYGPNGNQPGLFINEGNPDLKPSTTHNFDISVERYFSDIGVVKFGAFYKRTSNLLFDNRTVGTDQLDGVELPNDPRFQNLPNNIFVQVTRPDNNPDTAHLLGVEMSLEKRLTFLPGWLSGFGLYANYTRTESSKTEVVQFGNEAVLIKDVRYPSQPTHSGTLGLSYNKFGVDALLAYTMQSRYLSSFAPRGLSAYQDGISSLDLTLSYRPSWFKNARFHLNGRDLLRGKSDPSLTASVGGEYGSPRARTNGTYFGGRQLWTGVSISF